MSAENTILTVDRLQISFKTKQDIFVAVNGISFSLEKNRTLAIVGESGSGKSLTALAIMDLLPKEAATGGSIALQVNDHIYKLDGNTGHKDWQSLRGNAMGMVFQEPMSSLNPVMKIGKQLSECILAHQKMSGKQAKTLALEWLQKVQLSPALYHRYPHQLSGGQKQRVMIAMAMCNHPVLLIADEPTTALDVTVQKEVLELMRRLREEQGMAMIFITHDLALASETADEIMVMYKGEAVERGTAYDVLHHPAHPYTQALVACRPSPAHKGKRLPVIADFLQPGTTATPAITQPHTPTGNTLLRVNNLRVWFTEAENWLGKPTSYFKAVDGVSFDLQRGEVLGLVGESGCGKSTLSRSLIGLLPVREGQIMYNGKDLAAIPANEWKQVRREIQMIFQDPFASLNPRITIGDMLMEPMAVHGIVPKQDLKKEAQRLLDLVHLPADAFKRYPHQFSGGQRQRLGIARALALRPQLLICDESVSALDVSVQAQVLNLLVELKQEFQLTYLFISHDLSVVHYISDRVMVMQSGRIVESGEATQVLSAPAEDYTKKLVAAMPKLK